MRISTAIAGFLYALCLVTTAIAGVQTTSPNARIVIPRAELPDALTTGQWSMLVWVHVPQSPQEPSDLITIGGNLGIVAHPAGLTVTVQHRDQGARLEIDRPLQAGQWHLLAVSIDVRADRAWAWLATDTSPPTSDPIAAVTDNLRPMLARHTLTRATPKGGGGAAFEPWAPAAAPRAFTTDTHTPPGPVLAADTEGLIVGRSGPTRPAARAFYEVLVIRDHPINMADVRAVWDSRGVYAAHSLDNRGQGGRMNGWAGVPFMTFHNMSPLAAGPISPGSRASFVGGEVTTSNLIILTQPRPFALGSTTSLRATRPIDHAVGALYRSRLEPEFEGFFHIRPPDFDAPTEAIGPIGPKAAMLARGPRGIVKVIVSANSRGIRAGLPPQPWPENFAHGFVQALLPQTAGVLMRPSTFVDAKGGWFGFDTSTSTPETRLVRSFHTRDDAWADFTRFGTGTLPGTSRGPGPASNISPTGLFRMRCKPEPGSLMTADAPLYVRSTVLAFPGSSQLVWHPERGLMQSGPGLALAEAQTVDLDTTRTTHTLAADDQFETTTRLVLMGEVDVRPGDAIVPITGSARGAISVVTQVETIDGQTAITLAHPLGATPSTGNVLAIGPWRFESVGHTFEPVPEGDDRTWRGPVLEAADDGKLGVMVYALSAWRPDADGFAFGTAGQGGVGYTGQLEPAFPGATQAWAAATTADVWIQGLALQGSQPPAMSDYLDVLREGLPPEAEVVWASDAVHAHTTHSAWHHYLRDNARARGVPAIFAVGHPRLGDFFEQTASGMRTDDAHYSSFGSLTIARAWIEQIASLSQGPCDVADFNRDGAVDVFDIIEFQTAWAFEDPRADLDGDGQFLIFDYLQILTAMGLCEG